MLAADAKQLICQLFEDACLELFDSMQCHAQRVVGDELVSGETPIAFIDAGSQDFEMILTLRLPLPALTMTYPVQEQILNIDEKELEDWLLEMANRLLGLLKLKLTARNCAINTGLPTHDLGFDSNLSINQQPYFAFHFDVDDELVETGIRIESFSNEINMAAEPTEAASHIQAGELDFF